MRKQNQNGMRQRRGFRIKWKHTKITNESLIVDATVFYKLICRLLHNSVVFTIHQTGITVSLIPSFNLYAQSPTMYSLNLFLRYNHWVK